MQSPRPISGFLWITQLAEQLSTRVGQQVRMWSSFDKDGLGDQLTRAMDSVGLNISEGYARVHLRERLHFLSIASGSLEEALFAVRRARERGLLKRLDASILSGLLIKLSHALNAFDKVLRDGGK